MKGIHLLIPHKNNYIGEIHAKTHLDEHSQRRVVGFSMSPQAGLSPLKHIGAAYGATSGFPGGSDGKASARNEETRVRFLGWEDPLEKEMAIHSSTLAWKIPRTEELDRLQSMGLQRVGHDWATSLHFISQGNIRQEGKNNRILWPENLRGKSLIFLWIWRVCILHYKFTVGWMLGSKAPVMSGSVTRKPPEMTAVWSLETFINSGCLSSSSEASSEMQITLIWDFRGLCFYF